MDAAWIGFSGVILGAVIGLYAAKKSPEWLRESNRLQLRENIRSFVIDQLESYIRIIDDTKNARGQTGVILIAHLNRIVAEYQALDRNREHLMHVGDADLRHDFRGLLSDIYSTASLLSFYVGIQSTGNWPPGSQPLTDEELTGIIESNWHRFLGFSNQLQELKSRIETH